MQWLESDAGSAAGVGVTVPRHRLRAVCHNLGLTFGRAAPHARQLVVGADGDADLTLAPHLVITPAPLTPEQRTELHAATAKLRSALGTGSVAWGLDGDGEATVEHWLPADDLPPDGVSAALLAEGDGILHGIDGLPALSAPGEQVRTGTLLARLHASDAATLAERLATVAVWGVPSSLDRLRFLVEAVAAGRWSPALVASPLPNADLTVLAPGLQTTVQSWPGRIGWWEVGVPPSGPMDDVSARIANRLVGNAPGAALLECTVNGPTIRFGREALVALGGARLHAELDGEAVPWWRAFAVRRGATLTLGAVQGPGLRAFLAVRGGLRAHHVLGSTATFTLAGFGGAHGRALVSGDRLALANDIAGEPATVPTTERPVLSKEWRIGVCAGPHTAPEFLTVAGLRALAETEWTVSPQSNRTGVRLIGAKPQWARRDGGEAGLHPSNIHDVAYAFAAIDLTGDVPIVLGPDGPSTGGFVCPFVVVQGQRWKLGQLAAGNRVRLVVTGAAGAATLRHAPTTEPVPARTPEPPIRHRIAASAQRPETVYRRQGDDFLLVEYGPMRLDLDLRLRVHRLHAWLREAAIPGVIEAVPAVRSLQVHYDPDRLAEDALIAQLVAGEAELAPMDAPVPSRIVHLPLSWDDPATRKAIEIYTRTVNPTAPWCPSNIEFIRRINGLDSIDEVQRIVLDAEYLVLGLGDVYLGAPVATPVDPRHRLVTTKYNPARTWTPENAVGIGGAYLCVYGMEGPGGYQFVGRTVQVWNTWKQGGQPWLLRHFDRIRFHLVSAEELLRLREDLPHGRWQVPVEDGVFDPVAHRRRLAAEADAITAFTSRRDAAFRAERDRWAAAAGTAP